MAVLCLLAVGEALVRGADAGTLRLPLPVALPDTARTGCSLPPNGKVPTILTAPSGAPAPPTSPAPSCSSLVR